MVLKISMGLCRIKFQIRLIKIPGIVNRKIWNLTKKIFSYLNLSFRKNLRLFRFQWPWESIYYPEINGFPTVFDQTFFEPIYFEFINYIFDSPSTQNLIFPYSGTFLQFFSGNSVFSSENSGFSAFRQKYSPSRRNKLSKMEHIYTVKKSYIISFFKFFCSHPSSLHRDIPHV